ncbi:MAG: anaerobic ribonucleoside-triphosphate reductase activating protein [Patescibacteria group bacterium]|nr:anaerobic ribonucleoside-triphosphate reductase activating protein [Patescibacteria group bacterium]
MEKFTLIDYPGKIACMVYTIGCNFRCPYCHNPELVDETTEVRITEDELFDFLDKRRGMIEGVVITGGEPTMHDDLPELMRGIKDRGFLVKLDSNGTRPDMLREVIEKGLVDYIAMDIKSPLAAYARIASRPVDTGAIRRSVALLMSSAVEYEFRTTIVKSMLSPEDLRQIGREIRGARRYVLQKFVPAKVLNPQFRNKVSYSDKEMKEFQKMLNVYVDHCHIR